MHNLVKVRVPFYDIQAQYTELASEIDAAVHGVVSGGRYVMGPEHNAFESEIAAYCGVRHAIGVADGTVALRILMDAAGIGPGDEVITTAFTFVASTEIIVQAGATPVFVDIDPDHFDLATSLIEAAITPKTRAIMPIHLFGQMCEIETIRDIAQRRGLLLIEDSAQSLGATRWGMAGGKFSLGGGISFYVTKNLGAMGDAGMIVTDDDTIAERCRSIRVHGMGRERYYYDHLGYTARLDEIQAAFLRVKLRRLDAWTDRRRAIAERYLAELGETSVTLPQIREGNVATWHQFSIRSDQRDDLQGHLKERGIDSMIYYPVPLHFHTPYARFGQGEGSLPATEAASREILALPIHPHLSDEQVDWVIESVRAF